MLKVAISVGDLNGIGIQLALQNHESISKEVHPIYCIDKTMLTQAAEKLHLNIPDGFQTIEEIAPEYQIKAGVVTKESGAYAYASFVKAVDLAKENKVDAICTLPIHKKAWELAGIHYKGHTDALRDFFNAEAIMMLGAIPVLVDIDDTLTLDPEAIRKAITPKTKAIMVVHLFGQLVAIEAVNAIARTNKFRLTT